MEKKDNSTSIQFNRSYAGFVTIASLGVVHLINTCVTSEQTQTYLHYAAPSISGIIGYVLYCIFAPFPTPDEAKYRVEIWWCLRSLKTDLADETDPDTKAEIQSDIKELKKIARSLKRPKAIGDLKNSPEPKAN